MKLNFNLGFLGKKNPSEKDNTVKIVKCKTCNKTFENKDRLKIHSKKAHTGREKSDSHH